MNKSILTFVIFAAIGVAIALGLNSTNLFPTTFGDNGWAVLSAVVGMIVFGTLSFVFRKK